MDANKFLGSLSNKNFVFESAALTVLEGGFKKGKNFYAASITEREFTEVSFNRNLVNLVVSGNYPYLGRSYYSGNFGVSAAHYREFTFNYSHDLTKKLTIGAAAKILFGMSTVHSNGLHFRATSTALGNYLDVTASGRVRLSVPVDFDYTSRGEIKKVYSLPNYTARDYMINFSNPGFAMDLGLSYHLNKKTEISASIIDLGMIGWRSNVAQFIEQGHFLYRGLSLNDPAKTPPVITVLNPLINQLSDSISAAFRPDTSVTHFATLLPVKIYFGLDYQLNDIWNLSGLTRIRIINNTIHTSLTASANTLLWNRLTLSASYSLMESTFDNLGLGAGIKAGPFQLYAATDNIVSPFYPAKARNMNLRVGINFIFDHQKRGKSGSSLNPNCHCPY